MLAASSFAQQPRRLTDAPVKVVVVKGLTGVKDNTQGTLIIGDGSMHFAHEALKSDLATHSIEDVVTGDDSQRVIRGTLGTLVVVRALRRRQISESCFERSWIR